MIAVGTTSVRALEAAAQSAELIASKLTGESPVGIPTESKSVVLLPGEYETDILITPGYRFRAVQGLITNFHLPKSTLLMLVSAFAERDAIMKAYEEAIRQRYRFYSYGDAMLII